MDTTSEDIRAMLDTVCVALSSPLAQRIYALAAGSVFLTGCLVWAIQANRHAAANITKAERAFAQEFRGPTPTRETGIAKQQHFISERAPPLYRAASRSFWVSFLAGVVAPGAMLVTMTFLYGWFDPDHAHLLDMQGRPVSQPSLPQTLMFALDQTFRGGLFDLLEVFSVHVTPLRNNPANIWFSAGVFAHHLFVEAFIFSGILLYGQSRWRIGRLRRDALAAHEAKVDQAKAKKAGAGLTHFGSDTAAETG